MDVGGNQRIISTGLKNVLSLDDKIHKRLIELEFFQSR